MELDFSFTLVRSAPVKSSSKTNKQNQDGGSCGTVANCETKKQTSTLSLSRRKRYQNCMNENKVLNGNQRKGIVEKNILDVSDSDNLNRPALSDFNKSPVKNSTNKSGEDKGRCVSEIEENEDKENLSPVKKDTLVMNSDLSENKSSSNVNLSSSKLHSSNNSSTNKNSSSSSIETAEYVELKQVAIRKHQFESFRKYIRNDRLYFYKKKKNVVKEEPSISNNDLSGCTSRDMFSLSSATLNKKPQLEIVKNERKSVSKEISLSKSNSVNDCCNRKDDGCNVLCSSRHSLKTKTSVSKKLDNVKLYDSLDREINRSSPKLNSSLSSTPKGIKRSITVARNGFKKSEKSLNATLKSLNDSESLYFRSCTRSKSNVVINDDNVSIVDGNCSLKSVISETIDDINNDSINKVNKNVSLLNNSRLSGVVSLLSDGNGDSFALGADDKRSNNDSFNKISLNKKSTDLMKSKIIDTKNDDISCDMFDKSVKRKFSVVKPNTINAIVTKKDSLDGNSSFTKINLEKTDREISNIENNVHKSNSKTLKNTSLNSSLDFDNSIIESSTPCVNLKHRGRNGYRKNLKSRVKFDIDDKLNENDKEERKSIPLCLPLPSCESPLLSKSKVNDITKWLTETEKCKTKNPFESSDSNNEEELSVSPPLINKKFKTSNFVTNVGSESKIKSADVRSVKLQVSATPQPDNRTNRIRKPLTEPNKVNTATKSKPSSIQKKRSTKKERKKLDFSSDSDEMDNPAARILDQLYGHSWRALNALPVTEPRNQSQNRVCVTQPPKTEGKNPKKASMFSSSSSSDDHFEEFLEKTRLKRLELSEKRSQLKKINESSFIDKTLSDDNSFTLYHKTITSDIKNDIDTLSDSKWSGNSITSSKSSKKHPRRLSFSSIKGSENTNSTNLKSNLTSKRGKKIKKKSPDKIIKRHLPINISHHHSSDSSGKKKKNRKKKISKKKCGKELKNHHVDNVDEKILPAGLPEKIPDSAARDFPKTSDERLTPKVVKDSAEQSNLPNAADSLQKTPSSRSNATVFPATPRHTLSFLSSLSVVTANLRCHPDALMYKANFKTKKEELSRKLLMLYNKEVFESKLPNDMLLQWNGRMRSTSGFCYNRRLIKNSGEVQRTSRIVLSSKILDTPDRLRDTLIHEMCHAASWIINGVSDGHGPKWKYWASKAMLRFPELPKIKRCHDYEIKTKYTYRCTSCGYSFGRHSKSLDTERKRCGYCYGKFELLVSVKDKPRGNGRGGATPASSVYSDSNARTPRPVTGFALFVKENYSEVKKTNHALPHKDVMKLLGQKFSEFKFSQNNDKEPLDNK